MTTRKPRTLNEILADPASQLGVLAGRARRMADLGDVVRAALPPGAGGHLLGANLRDDTLILLFDSAAWAARVRYDGPRLLANADIRALAPATQIRVRVRPPSSPPEQA